ncbi:hypothetical protein HDU97_009849 [Phlyctochytrium planicorne]|nr:hypothetical protein HDU97_009849 [Phlyctochytrium planicorne]
MDEDVDFFATSIDDGMQLDGPNTDMDVDGEAIVQDEHPEVDEDEDEDDPSAVKNPLMGRSELFAPSIKEIEASSVSQLAESHWKEKVTVNKKNLKSLNELAVKLWNEEILGGEEGPRGIMVLEFSQYLENFLWPLVSDSSPIEVIFSIVYLINEKFRQRLDRVWSHLVDSQQFSSFFRRVLAVIVEQSEAKDKNLDTLRALVVFLTHAFQGMEDASIRKELLGVIGIGSWACLEDRRREMELSSAQDLRKAWNRSEKKYTSANSTEKKRIDFDRTFLSHVIKLYIRTLSSISDVSSQTAQVLLCERLLELFIDLESQIPTRRYIHTLLDDHLILPLSHRSPLMVPRRTKRDGPVVYPRQTFVLMLERFEFYMDFQIDNVSGQALSESEYLQAHYNRIQKLQRLCFAKFRSEFEDLALSSPSLIDAVDFLRKKFKDTAEKVLVNLCKELGIRVLDHSGTKFSAEFLGEILAQRFCRRSSYLTKVASLPVYPNEEDLFLDTSLPPQNEFSNDHCLPVPKLNLQFLTLADYLQRSFQLYRLESKSAIAQDLEDAVARLNPKFNYDSTENEAATQFFGWARMALPIDSFDLVDVGEANVFDGKPRHVRGKINYNVGNYNDSIRKEWDSLKKHDAVFLVSIQLEPQENVRKPPTDFLSKFGVRMIRGCEIIDLSGEDGQSSNGQDPLKGERRTLRVLMDVDQYLADLTQAGKPENLKYSTFNVLVRRKARENNFKAVLETIRDLLNADVVLPEWFADTFLGYGDPEEAIFVNQVAEDEKVTVDLRDTLLDVEHVKEVFGDKDVSYDLQHTGERPLFSVTMPAVTAKKYAVSGLKDDMSDGSEISVKSYSLPYSGPFKDIARRHNEVRFTKAQLRAIVSASSPGLTMVSGPPGTGKTDVAVQIISNLYHAHPNQNILLITHSNHALNQLFEKIMGLDIDPRHLLRLGHGFEDIDSDSNWGKYGRVQSFLELRATMLAEVDKLAYTLGIQGAFGNSCETAGYFYAFHVKSLWEPYLRDFLIDKKVDPAYAASKFPFLGFFYDAPQPLFPPSATLEDVRRIAHGCYGHIREIFEKLDEIRAFELLRNNHERSNYLLIKEAKIIALTCTYAALKRRELISLGFKYDTIIMEEAAQILEVEAFIPMVLQTSVAETGESRLQRVVLIGDQNQLPPIVKNVAVSRYGNFEQSLFTRLLRLEIPPVLLDRQGRSRKSICDLYRWRYNGLMDLEDEETTATFDKANPGFSFDYQFINVEDYNGKGETEPVPYFFQNLGEAEYVVATYQYMRLLGYPAHKISILTTYNGQKALIEDVLERRCKRNPMFGLPARISTVDKFQGQENDYILLSLVRTKTVGHIRDVRRLVVALSRARLGLYVFGRKKLFENCYELQPAFSVLLQRPSDEFWLCGKEEWSTEFDRKVEDTGCTFKSSKWVAEKGKDVFKIQDVTHMGKYVFNMIQEQVEWMKKKATSNDA